MNGPDKNSEFHQLDEAMWLKLTAGKRAPTVVDAESRRRRADQSLKLSIRSTLAITGRDLVDVEVQIDIKTLKHQVQVQV